MNRYERYLMLSTDLITNYNGSVPFAIFLKNYFSANKQLGSRDRKQISMSCYAWFRVGKLLTDIEPALQVAAARFLCHTSSDELLASLFPEWNREIHLSIEEKCDLLNIPWNPLLLFPLSDQLSENFDFLSFVKSHFIQPDLFVRVRPGKAESVKMKLASFPFSFQWVAPNTLRLPNGTRMEDFFHLNDEIVVQDLSSQRLASFFERLPFSKKDAFVSWDACAASGGKTILLKDYFPNIRLTVSDKRSSILNNLQKRLKEAGLEYERAVALDLIQPVPDGIIPDSFDLILADVPCSGSGTWSRTPEWLHFFNLDQLKEYADLQYRIVQNIIPFLKPGGYLLYSTCSVYAVENEKQMKRIADDFKLSEEASYLLKGFGLKADTMFGALLKK